MHDNILSVLQQQKMKVRKFCRNHPVISPPGPVSTPRDFGLSTLCTPRMVSLFHTCSWKKCIPLLLEYSNSILKFF